MNWTKKSQWYVCISHLKFLVPYNPVHAFFQNSFCSCTRVKGVFLNSRLAFGKSFQIDLGKNAKNSAANFRETPPQTSGKLCGQWSAPTGGRRRTKGPRDV